MPSELSDIELTKTFLIDRTIGCPACQYNLRGSAGDMCPECGTKIDLHLVSMDIRLGWWLIGLLAIALPLGFASIFGCTAIFGAWRSVFWSEADWWMLGALSVLTLFYSMCLIAVIRRRRKFLRLSRLEQRVRAIGLTIIMISLQILLFYVFKRYSQF